MHGKSPFGLTGRRAYAAAVEEQRKRTIPKKSEAKVKMSRNGRYFDNQMCASEAPDSADMNTPEYALGLSLSGQDTARQAVERNSLDHGDD